MATLATVICKGVYSAIPAAGMAGRIYFATDSGRIFYDTGTIWTDVTPPALSGAQISLVPSAPGNFTVAHGLGAAPTAVSITMTSGGQIWLQNPTGYNATNLYLVASDAGVTGTALCFK